jgi:hypothetical protein
MQAYGHCAVCPYTWSQEFILILQNAAVRRLLLIASRTG